MVTSTSTIASGRAKTKVGGDGSKSDPGPRCCKMRFFFEDSIKDHNKYGVHFFLIGLYIWKDFFDDVLLIELGHAWTENESETATTVAFN